LEVGEPVHLPGGWISFGDLFHVVWPFGVAGSRYLVIRGHTCCFCWWI
jgi:hypothetical protein